MTEEDVIAEIEIALSRNRQISNALLHKWLKVDGDRVVAKLISLFCSRMELLELEQASRLTDTVLESLVTACEYGSRELTPGEALEYLRCMFIMWWRIEVPPGAMLDRLKRSIAQLVSGWPAEGTDLALLIIVEHLFVDRSIRDFFVDWKAIENLRCAFEEGVSLSEGFSDLEL